MLLIALFIVLAIVVARSFILLFTKGALSQISTAVTIVAAVILGMLFQPIFMSRQSAPSIAAAPNASPAAATSEPIAGTAVAPKGIKLSHNDVVGLSLVPNPPALGYIGTLSDQHGVEPAGYRFHAGQELLVGGWAADPRTKKPGAGLIAIVDGVTRTDASAFYGQSRPDVVAVFKTLDMERTGFLNIPISTKGLALGNHVVQIGVVGDDGGHYFTTPTLSRGFTIY